jgi:peptidoglycan/LPS O-acetylase OafA/YrhL
MYLILDIARGIAALSVFLYHEKGALDNSIPILAKIAQFGDLGVPLFFVISGYVITASAEVVIRKKQSSNSFLKRRFLRIYPPFWISIFVVVSMPYIISAISSLKSGIYQLPEQRYLALTNMDWAQLISLTKIFMSENKDLQGQFNEINSVYWTLAIEFQFYLCIYVALIFRKYFHLIISTITIISLLLFVYSQKLNAGLFIHFWPMFAMGILLYYVIGSGLTLEKMFVHNSRVIAAIIIIMSISSITFLSYLGVLKQLLDNIFSSSNFGFALISSCILWFAAPLETVLEGAKNGKNSIVSCLIKIGAFLGAISYSLYLLHGKIAELPAMLARQIVSINSVLYPIFIVGGTVALSSIFYIYIEKPLMSKKPK